MLVLIPSRGGLHGAEGDQDGIVLPKTYLKEPVLSPLSWMMLISSVRVA